MVAIFCVIFIAAENPFNQYVLSRQSIPFDYPLSRVCHLGENERRARSRLDAWNGRGFLPNLLRR
jgi:hypothetical protein